MYSSTKGITEDITKLQSDILLEDLRKNPFFRHHVLVEKNAKLDTNSQQIIGAINELLRKVKGNRETYTAAITELYSVMGHIGAHPELSQQVFKRADSLIELVLDLDKKIGKIDVTKYKDIVDIFEVGEESQNNFVLRKTPMSDITILVNGVQYNNATIPAYSLNLGTKTVSWLFDKENGGFDLSKCEVIIKYQYDASIEGDE